MKHLIRKYLSILLVLVTLLTSIPFAALAEALATITLPNSLKVIEEKAFYGDTSIEKVVVPEGATEIGSEAFADSSLVEIELPDSLESIADNTFDGVEDLTITAPEDSYAYDWAVKK